MPPFGSGVRRWAPAISSARTPSGQAVSVGARAISWAATPATIGEAMLVPSPMIPLAVLTLTDGAETLGLL